MRMVSGNKVAGLFDNYAEMIVKVKELVRKINPTQDELNKLLAKNDNYATSLKVENGKHINYGNCLLSEFDEIRNSTPWKHWKFAGDIDLENLNMEIVDVFHFGPSISLVLESRGKVDESYIDDLFSELGFIYDTFIDYSTDKEMELMDVINMLNVAMTFKATPLSLMFYRMKYNGHITEEGLELMYISNLIIMIIAVIIHQLAFETTLDESIDMIYSTYIVKNTINKFRDAHGYNDGSYIKIWDGNEDNAVALEIMKSNPTYTPKELYTELETVYGEIVK